MRYLFEQVQQTKIQSKILIQLYSFSQKTPWRLTFEIENVFCFDATGYLSNNALI